MLKAYNGDQAFKAKFLEQLRWHKEQDAIVSGSYGGHYRRDLDAALSKSNFRWRGCAVACSLRSLDMVEGLELKTHNSNHHDLAKRLGIPPELAYAEDVVFENLSTVCENLENDGADREWPLRFGEALPVGADLSQVFPKLMLWILEEPSSSLLETEQRILKDLYEAEIQGLYYDLPEAVCKLASIYNSKDDDTAIDLSEIFDEENDFFDMREGIDQLLGISIDRYENHREQAVAVADKLIELIEAC